MGDQPMNKKKAPKVKVKCQFCGTINHVTARESRSKKAKCRKCNNNPFEKIKRGKKQITQKDKVEKKDVELVLRKYGKDGLDSKALFQRIKQFKNLQTKELKEQMVPILK